MSGNDQYGRRLLLWGDTAEVFGFTFWYTDSPTLTTRLTKVIKISLHSHPRYTLARSIIVKCQEIFSARSYHAHSLVKTIWFWHSCQTLARTAKPICYHIACPWPSISLVNEDELHWRCCWILFCAILSRMRSSAIHRNPKDFSGMSSWYYCRSKHCGNRLKWMIALTATQEEWSDAWYALLAWRTGDLPLGRNFRLMEGTSSQ